MGVYLVVLVPSGAVGFAGLMFSTHPSSVVFRSRDGLQVVRVDTSSIAAKVIDFKPLRDILHQKFIRNPVSHAAPGAGPYSPVPLGIFACEPFPAAGASLDLLVKPANETRLQWFDSHER